MIKVVDDIMGSGKTSAAINMMNNDLDGRYIFVTPYLNEVERVKQSCYVRRFYDPKNYDNDSNSSSKLNSLHSLLASRENIVTTHALFTAATEETQELIRAGDYILILDEVVKVISQCPLPKGDQLLLQDCEMYHVDDQGFVYWNEENEKAVNYEGYSSAFKKAVRSKTIMKHSDSVFIQLFPKSMFDVFSNVYVLTYLFEGQMQSAYFQLYDMTYEKYHVQRLENGTLTFKIGENKEKARLLKQQLKKKINVLEGSMNKVGEKPYTLSSGWYDKNKYSVLVKQVLKNNLLNYFKNINNVKANDIIWTTLTEYKDKLKGKGYTSSFLPCNARATNSYGDRHYLAYMINRFENPILKGFFSQHGVKFDEDMWATSEIVQWIWRSAIRNNEDIHVYIPSKRMRKLFFDWLET